MEDDVIDRKRSGSGSSNSGRKSVGEEGIIKEEETDVVAEEMIKEESKVVTVVEESAPKKKKKGARFSDAPAVEIKGNFLFFISIISTFILLSMYSRCK